MNIFGHIKVFRFLIFIIISLHSIEVFSQEPEYTYYSTDDGLPSNEVYHALQDSKGYIWFSTDNGVSRFNGYEFENFDLKDGLVDNTIFFMYEDYKNRIWFISYSHQLSYFHIDSIYNYKYNSLIAKTISSKNMIVKPSFFVDSLDAIHFGTFKQGVFVIDSNGNLKNDFGETSLKVTIDNEKTMVSGSGNGDKRELLIEDKGVQKYLKKLQTVNYATEWNFAIKVDTDHFLFACDKNVKDINKGQEINYTFNANIPWMSQDRDSNLWVSIYGEGVYRYRNLKLEAGAKHYLKSKTVTSTTVDTDGALWITALDGVYYFPSLKIESVKPSPMLIHKKVRRLVKGVGNEIWFSTNNADVFCLKEREVIPYLSEEKGLILDLAYNKLDNELVFGGRNIYGFIRGGERINFREVKQGGNKKPDAKRRVYVKRISQVNDTITYYNNTIGVGQVVRENNIISYFDNKFLSSRGHCIYHLEDKAFLVGCKNGLWRYENNSFEYLGEDDKWLKNRIDDIVVDNNGNYWLASKGNGIILKKKDTTFQITTEDGLSSNTVTCLLVDDNVIWAGSINGVNKIIVDENKKEKIKIERIYQYHGLASNGINDLVIDNGKLYVGTDNGLSYFDISSFELNTNTTPIYLKSIKVSEENMNLLDHYDLEYFQNTISIEYTGLNYRKKGDLFYKYKLIGADENWVITPNREVRYPSLTPGHYRFEVLAMNENGAFGTDPATVSFTIQSPYWKTWWFHTIMLSIFLLFFYAIIVFIQRIKIREVKKRSQLLESLTQLRQEALAQQMNPHFIFNSLSSIQYFISKNDKQSSSKYLRMFSNLMRLTLNNSYKKYISFTEEIEALELYMQLEQLRFDHKFEYTLDVDKEINMSKYMIPSLFLQPFVENAIWHGLAHKESGSGLIEVKVTKTTKTILCTIKDNGIGRKKSKEINLEKNKTHKSLGLKITESRLKLINREKGGKLLVGYIDLTDEKGEACGTEVKMTLPVNKNN